MSLSHRRSRFTMSTAIFLRVGVASALNDTDSQWSLGVGQQPLLHGIGTLEHDFQRFLNVLVGLEIPHERGARLPDNLLCLLFIHPATL